MNKPQGVALLEKITNKWSLQIYYEIGPVIQIREIFKKTGILFKIAHRNREYNLEDLLLVNVADPDIQKDWEIVREILGKITREASFYEANLTRVESELLGFVFKK
jgi:hypothetical protein